jgi:hypothetical protein
MVIAFFLSVQSECNRTSLGDDWIIFLVLGFIQAFFIVLSAVYLKQKIKELNASYELAKNKQEKEEKDLPFRGAAKTIDILR